MTEATAQEPDTCLDTATRLADLTTMRVGGPAQRIVTAHDADELVAAVQAADAAGEPLLIVSGGSNLLVADAGFDLLDSPIKRVTAPDTPVPFSPTLEAAYVPSVETIVQTVKSLF